jgi:hypothetical protein
MSATDNKYPITYDGVDPSTILPSLNPHEGWPIKRTSSSSDLSVVAIIRGQEEHPWLSSMPATPMLHKGAYSTGKKTGFFLPKSSEPYGIAKESTLYGNGLLLPAVMGIGDYIALGGTVGLPQPSGSAFDYSGGNGSVLASLDDVFYRLYIKDYLGIATDGPSGATGIYSIPGGKEFLGLNNQYLGPFPNILLSSFSSGNFTSNRTLFPYNNTGGFWEYSKWFYQSEQLRSKFLISTQDYTIVSEDRKYGAVEGWHTIPVIHHLLYTVKTNSDVRWMRLQQAGYSSVFGGSIWWCRDKFSIVGSSDSLAPENTSYGYENNSSWMLLCYAMPQRPATPISVYEFNGTAYDQSELQLDTPSLNGSQNVNKAKEVSVSQNGKIIMLATDTGQATYGLPRITKETLFMFKRVYASGSYAWRNAYIMSGLTPAASNPAATNAEFTQKQSGNLSKNPITASMDNALNLGQFNTIAVSDSANWVIGNNFGWTNKNQSTGSNSSITTDLYNIYPAAARAVSRNTQIISQPTQGSEYGGAGSPTIAMAVSNNGVVVKADRNVEGRISAVRVPIVGLDGGSLVVQIDDSDIASYLTKLTLGGNAIVSATIDIDENGVAPELVEYDCVGSTWTQFTTNATVLSAGQRIRFTQLGAGSSGVAIGNSHHIALTNSTSLNIFEADSTGQPTTTFINATLTAGTKIQVARGIRPGELYSSYIVQLATSNQYKVGLPFTANEFSNIGTNAYVLFHITNKVGTFYTKSFRTTTGFWYSHEIGTPVKRNSTHNIKSYRESLYANVTIGGQQVLPASPVQLTNALYGPFGACVAIDDDGETVAVSSPSEGHIEDAIAPPECEGAVYIYKKMGDEGGGFVWAQTNRITVPRVVGYFGGPTGSIPHIQFGSSLEFSGANLLIGSRQGVYIYEIAVGLFSKLSSSTTISGPVNSKPALEFVSYIHVISTLKTTTAITATLSGAKIPLDLALGTSTTIGADLLNPPTQLLAASVSTSTKCTPNLTIGSKLVIGTARLESGSKITSNLTFNKIAFNSKVDGTSSLGVIVTGGAGIRCEINLGGSYSGNLSRFVNIPSTLTLSGAISLNDILFRINPYLIESSTATATSIVANLGYVRVELSATLYKSTSIVVSAAKLVTLGTSDARQANIFEVGKASSATIGGLGQRWIKRSDLQNSDLTTSVEWVEGQPPQLD